MTEQMSLALSLRDDCRFDNFLALSEAGSQVVAFLEQRFSSQLEKAVYLWGADGSGRSHLMQAVCHDWLGRDKSVQYLPLTELRNYPPEQVMADLEYLDLVCIDEVNLVADQDSWLEQLFHFFNRSRAREGCLLISADAPPSQLGLSLADLQSRLSASTVFQLPSYSDPEKIRILQFRARCLGLQLSNEAAQFLLNRAPRQLGLLVEKLRELDHSSLVHQRRLSIPFIKEVFSW